MTALTEIENALRELTEKNEKLSALIIEQEAQYREEKRTMQGTLEIAADQVNETEDELRRLREEGESRRVRAEHQRDRAEAAERALAEMRRDLGYVMDDPACDPWTLARIREMPALRPTREDSAWKQQEC